MSEQDDDAIAADEAARIAALQRMAPDRIWLQVDPEGDTCSSEWSLLDGATWCADRINSTDVEYTKAGKDAKQRDELLAALEECLAAYSASPKRPPDLVDDWEKCLARIDKANKQARAAIAKVKP